MSRPARIAPTRRHHVGGGDDVGAGLGWIRLCSTRTATVSSLRTAPSFIRPSWPWLLVGSSATSVMIPTSGTARFTAPHRPADEIVGVERLRAGRVAQRHIRVGEERDGRNAEARRALRVADDLVHREPLDAGMEAIGSRRPSPSITNIGQIRSSTVRVCSRTSRRDHSDFRLRRGRWVILRPSTRAPSRAASTARGRGSGRVSDMRLRYRSRGPRRGSRGAPAPEAFDYHTGPVRRNRPLTQDGGTASTRRVAFPKTRILFPVHEPAHHLRESPIVPGYFSDPAQDAPARGIPSDRIERVQGPAPGTWDTVLIWFMRLTALVWLLKSVFAWATILDVVPGVRPSRPSPSAANPHRLLRGDRCRRGDRPVAGRAPGAASSGCSPSRRR